MSRFFGPPTQLGIVVPALEPALDYWTGVVGAGPFYVIDDLQHEAFTVGEEAAPPPKMRIALGNWGEMQIELIEPHGDSEATWHQFLRARGGGIHHVSVWTDDYDAMVASARERGLAIEVTGHLAGGVRYTYFRAPSPADPLVEISELIPEVVSLYAMLRDAARDWDGTDPVRRLG